jgi:hypothetical protein
VVVVGHGLGEHTLPAPWNEPPLDTQLSWLSIEQVWFDQQQAPGPMVVVLVVVPVPVVVLVEVRVGTISPH